MPLQLSEVVEGVAVAVLIDDHVVPLSIILRTGILLDYASSLPGFLRLAAVFRPRLNPGKRGVAVTPSR
jgi:hypothetical protein